MSTSNKFVIYKCDTCNRQTEIQLDGKRPDPIRCNITYKCRGRLTKVSERTVKQFLFTPPVTGLQDYVQRGTVAEQQNVIELDSKTSMMSGSLMLSAAVLRKYSTGPASSVFVYTDNNGVEHTTESVGSIYPGPYRTSMKMRLYEITDDLIQYTKYVFLRSGFSQLIVGTDNSPVPMTLNFNSDNLIRVFVNGVELNDTEFDRETVNQIKLITPIYDDNNIFEIFVYKNLVTNYADEDLISLTFESIDSTNSTRVGLLSGTAWGDHLAVAINNENLYMLHCLDIGSLKLDHSYGVLDIKISDVYGNYYDVDPTTINIVLASTPYMYHDKQLHAYINGESLLQTSVLLAYTANINTGQHELVVSSRAITNVFNSITAVIPVSDPPAQSSSIASNVMLKRNFIIGPV